MGAIRFLIPVLALFSKQVMAFIPGKVKFLLNYYDQSGKEGYQVYDDSKDEELAVFEPMLFVQAQITETTNLNAHFIFDTWTAASDTKLDGNTGASGAGIDRQSRIAGQLGIAQDYKTWKWSGRMGISSEYDYQSLNFGGSLEGHFAQDNFVLAISPQVFLDQAKNFDYVQNKTGDFQSRFIASTDISATQLITRNDLWQFGYTVIHMNGMLNNISNSLRVQTEFDRVGETLPTNRLRHALHQKWIHAFSDILAAHIAYRYYTDDWDLKAHTYEVGMRLSLNEDSLFLMPSYRYYQQTAVAYWKSEFAQREPHMTSDSDLAKFNSSRYGIHSSWILGDKNIYKLDLKDWELSTAFYYYQRSNQLNYFLAQVGIGANF